MSAPLVLTLGSLTLGPQRLALAARAEAGVPVTDEELLQRGFAARYLPDTGRFQPLTPGPDFDRSHPGLRWWSPSRLDEWVPGAGSDRLGAYEAASAEDWPRLRAALAAGAGLLIVPVAESRDVLIEFLSQLRLFVQALEVEWVRPPLPRPAAEPGSGPNAQGLRIGFQGERGAYSELAVFSLFRSAQAQARPFKSFRDVYEAVLDGQVDGGLLPMENALAGPVYENFDLLAQYPDLEVLAETQIRIEHNLIARPGTPLEDIRKVLSHPQGLAQSAAFLDRHPAWERVPFYDTAGSVAHVAASSEPGLAAIASAVAAEVYGMTVLVRGVETDPRNFTRFFLIGRPGRRLDLSPAAPNKASLLFAAPDAPGSLSRCLAVLSRNGLNMKKIESRPIHGRPWSYRFFIDVEYTGLGESWDRALEDLKGCTEDLRVLGIYRSSL